jgi:hypothetical protein
MTRHIGYIHGSEPEPFSPPEFCRSGAGLEEYAYHYQKGYRRATASRTRRRRKSCRGWRREERGCAKSCWRVEQVQRIKSVKGGSSGL